MASKEKKFKLLKEAIKGAEMFSTVKKKEDTVSNMPSLMAWTPSFTVATKDVPFLEDAKVGEMRNMVIKAKIVGHNASVDSGKKYDDYRIEIHGIGCAGKVGEEEDEEDED